MIARADITLGVLAGGLASRLGGIDKAWLRRDGIAQVLRWQRRFATETAAVLVSTNRDPGRYRDAGLEVVADAVPDAGPLAGLQALAARCRTPWLLTVPVDLVGVNECLLPTLVAAGPDGAFAEDDDGPQPLVALWRLAALAPAAATALAQGDGAVQAVQSRLGMQRVRFAGVRFGNLNTPADLVAAGVEPAT